MNKIKQLETFSLHLKELRRKKHKKQTDMADILGCTWSHYQKIEYGTINISVCMLLKIANYFDVTTDYLLGRTDEGGPPE